MNRRQRKKLQRRLTVAAGWADAKQVAELLRAGADPNLREDHGNGRTATEWADLGDHRSTLELLRGA